MKRISLIALALLFIMMSSVQAQSPQEILNQYIADLQKNPNDYALREKIIKLVQTMKQKPVMSSEAEKYEGRAEYAIKNAKNEADFLDAAKEYDKALLLAPWVSSYYFNQAIAYEKAGKPKEAKQSFEFYLLAAPDAQDARDVRKRIAGLEYAAEKAAKDKELAARKAVEDKRAQQEDVEAKKAREQQDFLKKIDGTVYSYFRHGMTVDGHPMDYTQRLYVRGDTITMETYTSKGNSWKEAITYKIDGRTLRCFVRDKAWPQGDAIISEDGSTITLPNNIVFKRER